MADSAARLGKPFVRFPVRGFGGGLNKAVSSFNLRDDELLDCKNVEFDLAGAVRVRKGFRRLDLSGDHLAAGRLIAVKGMARYTRTDGHRELLIQAGRFVYANNESTNFTELLETQEGTDGFLRFTQWRDTMYIYSDLVRGTTYNKDETPELRSFNSTGNIGADTLLDVNNVTSNSSTFSQNDFVNYRLTFDRFHGKDFVGESVPWHFPIIGDIVLYHEMGLQIAADNDVVHIIKRDWDGDFSIFPFDDVKNINIYRRVSNVSPPGNFVSIPSSRNVNANPLSDYFFVGQISATDWTSAANGSILFVDTGTPFVGNSITGYDYFAPPPKARFMVSHKNRMWYLGIGESVFDPPLSLQNISRNLFRVYFSEYLRPESVRATSFFDIGPADGESITGVVSWKNRGLFIFKPNSIWQIFGGDDESIDSQGRTTGVIDVTIEAVDSAIGCIAPESIAVGEGGIIFLSNRGVYFFNGSQAVSLNTELIKPILDEIPSHRREIAAGVYWNKKRKYLLALTDQSVNPSRNSVTLEFDFFTKTWSRVVFGGTTDLGINNYIEAKSSDESGTLYGALDLEGLAQVSLGAVQIIGDVLYENLLTTGVPWEITTKFFDAGEPDIVKNFKAIIVRAKTPHSITVDYDVDDGKVTGSETFTPTGVHTWNEAGLSWLGPSPEDETHIWIGISVGGGVQADTVVPFPDGLNGRRIGFKFSGTATLAGTEIQGLTIVYTREPRVDQ